MDDHNNNNSKKKALFKEVFGDSSDSEDNEQQTQQPQLELEEEAHHQNPSWEQIKEIKGLWLCRDFLSPPQQSSLVSAILNGACVSLLLCTTFLLNWVWVSPTLPLTHCVCFVLLTVLFALCTCRRMVHWTLTQPGPYHIHILMLLLKIMRPSSRSYDSSYGNCNSSHHLNFLKFQVVVFLNLELGYWKCCDRVQCFIKVLKLPSL